MIKKHWNKNEYYYCGNGLWVRNFTLPTIKPVDINDLIPENDMILMLNNEVANRLKMHQNIATESLNCNKIIIVGDGYKFNEKQTLLNNLPNDVVIIGVNNSLYEWNNSKKMNFYVVNNPYEECMQYIPSNQKTFPRCISSTRTFPKFTNRLNAPMTFEYSPTPDKNYCGIKDDINFIDDYRNPTCAAIVLSYKFNVKKIMLFCCEEMYDSFRPATIKLSNDMWAYPQQIMANNLIDGSLFWLKNTKEIKIGHHSYYKDYKNSTYIDESLIAKFFNE